MTLASVDLNDKYTRESGRIFLTGIQALVRLPLVQRWRDLKAGLNTAGFISGYRGSPLGGYDQALWRARAILAENHVRFEPGVNEDLALTAVWGTQQLHQYPGPKYDGVFGIWYGKGPGVDRSGDVFHQGSGHGTSRHGGILAISGDDHAAKSSTSPHQTEHTFIGASMPVLVPSDIQDYLDFGLFGIAMSRLCGLWVGFKTISENAESTATIDTDVDRLNIIRPADLPMPDGGLNLRWPDDRFEQERRLFDYKLPAALAFCRANAINRTVLTGPKRRFGIVTTGKAYLDVMEALAALGIDAGTAREIGLSVYKVGMVWPLEPEGIRAFARGLDEILVVEEKSAIIEEQARSRLYDLPESERPRVSGKSDDTGRPQFPIAGELSPGMVARVIARRIGEFHTSRAIDEHLAFLDSQERAIAAERAETSRVPYFCSGCPHNTGTRLPEGSVGGAGIGCHFMALDMNRRTAMFTQMGGEGAQWIGAASFTETGHVFQNMGDGTYFHSGLMAIRANVTAGTNITYKILFNDAVAMTGGQPLEGQLSVPEIARQVHAEGVARVAIVTDEADKYPIGTDWPPGTQVYDRHALLRVQRELRETPGTTVLIYDQTCAAEKRRRRKRGLYPDPAQRAFINDLVCEGCGDCSVKSNCVSVEPFETEFGRKREINQSACNKDFSCIEGFCPSFVTIHGGGLRRPNPGQQDSAAHDNLPDPTIAPTGQPYGILVTGVGGTGVVTIGALIGMAAHLEGKSCTILDVTGLAQKGGAVMSHVRVADRADDLHAVRLASGGADVVLACDMVVAADSEALARMRRDRTHAVVNSRITPTARFTLDPDTDFHEEQLRRLIRDTAGSNATDFVDATGIATTLLGDAIATNLFLTGYAYQRGLLPVGAEAIEHAIELNGVAVDLNRDAFRWGRAAARDRVAVEDMARSLQPSLGGRIATEFDDIVAIRERELVAYQDRAYADRYRGLVARAAEAEKSRARGFSGFAEAVARNYFRLLAYKDEYEVARLFSDGRFRSRLSETFDGPYEIRYHLSPPLLARIDPETGEPRKYAFGAWIAPAFRLLAGLRALRGTPLDPFGYSADRRLERRLITEYETVVEELIGGLSPDNHAFAVEIAGLPSGMRGFGPVKARNVVTSKEQEAALLATFRDPGSRATAAE
jgi:indolepyruvate ferredoxin oxidoreductase